MTRLTCGLVAACLGLAACSGASGTYVVVQVEQGTAPAGITKVSLALALGGQATSRDLDNGGAPLTFPITAAFEIGTGKGDLMVTATGLAGPQSVAQGMGSGVVVRDKTSTITVVLAPSGGVMPGMDANVMDAADGGLPPTDGPIVVDDPDAMLVGDAKGEAMPMPGVAFLVANRSSVDFGTTLIGMSSPTVSIKVTNTGGDVSGSLAVSLSGSFAFSTANDVCSGKGLMPQESCTAGVVFMPSAAGAATGSLTITGLPGGTLKIDLAASGVAGGALQITPASNSFAETEKGKASAEVEFTVSNAGGTPTGTLTVMLSGSDAQDFALGANGCTNMLAANGTCKVGVKFSPKGDGAKSASLTVSASPGGTAVATLDGKALAPAVLEVSPTSNNFGSVVKAQKSGVQVFEVTNTGGVSSGTPVAALINDTMNNFILGSNTCTAALAPKASCQVQVQFMPSDVGSFSAKLQVTAAGLSVVSDLSGVGLAPGSLQITPAIEAFDPTVVGAKSAAKTFTIKNAGGASTGALTGMLTGSATAEFPVASNGCANKVLAPNETCTIVIQMQPAVAGTRAASLAISAAPGGSVTAQMSGLGLAPAAISLSPAGETFGSVVTGGSVDKTFTVTNTGDVATGTLGFNVSGANAGEFVVQAGAPGDCILGTTRLDSVVQSCKLRVRFTPAAVALRTATLNVSAAPGGAKSANMDGTGLAQGQISANASSKDFGLVEVGTASSSFAWKLTNVGGVATGVPTISASIPAAFLVTNNCTSAIAPNQSCEILISFKPASGGAQNFTLGLSAAPGGMAQLSMTGRGGYRLSVTTAGAGRGTVTSDVGGISCPGTCAAVYDSGTTVTLNAQTENGSDSYFTGFVGPGCQGAGPSCLGTLASAPVNITANFALLDANLVFVSSESFPATLGGAEKYDSMCNELASKAGINSKSGDGYIAWMSDNSSVAFKRLDGADGWRRRDGIPVTATLDSLLAKHEIWNPILLDEYGNNGGTNTVMTGTDPEGNPADSCTNWTSSDGASALTAGERSFGPGAWTSGSPNASCSSRNRIYCFGKARSATVEHSSVKGTKRIYISGTPSGAGKLFTPGGGIAAAHDVCAAHAPKGATSVRALLAQDGRSAASFLVGTTLYVTPSGERIGTGDQLAKGSLFTGLWETSEGLFSGPTSVYTGAPSLTANGDAMSTCSNWAGTSIGLGGPIVGFSSSTQPSFFSAPLVGGGKNLCLVPRPIYCVEQ